MSMKAGLFPMQDEHETGDGRGVGMQRADARTDAECQTREPGADPGVLESSAGMEFCVQGRKEIYGWTKRVLVAQEFAGLAKKERGLVRAYIGKITGLSPAQVTRLIRKYQDTGRIEASSYRRH